MSRAQARPARTGEIMLLGTSIVLVLGLLLLVLPVTNRLTSTVEDSRVRAATYDQSLEQFQLAVAADQANPAINPDCLPQLLHHNAKTAKVIVFFHGFTNCPQQFVPLAQQLHEQGYTVVIPRMSYHGYADRETRALAQLTPDIVRSDAEAAIELAHGLGDQVITVGLSTGGVMAAWAAQERDDLYASVVIAPMFGPYGTPRLLNRPLTKLAGLAPYWYVWWDPERKTELPGPQYAYPGFPIGGISPYMTVGQYVLQQAHRSPPRTERLAVVTNKADVAVSDSEIAYLLDQWNAWELTYPVKRLEFEASAGLNHDIIDQHQIEADTELVYPRLIRLINEL